MIRIIGGDKKRIKLDVPETSVRPTSSAKKEAIFSILESIAIKEKIDIYKEKYFLDLFAGSGAMGLEAISRGGKFCYFYENSDNVIKVLKNNCKKICNLNNYIIIKEDINISDFYQIENYISVIFMDPPYVFNKFEKIITNLLKSNIVTEKTKIVIETKKNTKINFPKSLEIINVRKYGNSKITFFQIC